MDIAEVARRSGVPASALRYYEEKGLIASTGREGLRRTFPDRVLDQLSSLSVALHVLCSELGGRLRRFQGYDELFAAALTRAEQGEQEWVARPRAHSCHTVWMELHEDLIATLGIQRGAEPRR